MTPPSILSRRSGPVRLDAGPRAGELIHEARGRERAGCLREAQEYYEAAIAVAERSGEQTVRVEALRRLSVVRFRRGDSRAAHELCQASYQVAVDIGSDLLAGEALNTLGGLQLQEGALRDARETLLRAAAIGAQSRELNARVEQNLGVLANIQGDLEAALGHYARSLAAYRDLGDQHGCAIAFHNLGIVSADRELWEDADRYFEQSLAIAEATGDVELKALCLVNHAEAHVARQRYGEAQREAEAALVIFDQVGTPDLKAEAYRVIGMVYRETGRPVLAESRLRSAIELGASTGSVLREAEATRELAILYQGMGRNQEALSLLNAAHRLFNRLDARVDLINVAGKVAELETTYMAVVRQWGESIESADSYTFGHCERVASYAVAVARALGLDEEEQTAIRLGAYLHDVGKVRVPHEVLNKPGPLTAEEREVVQMHPVWGIELVAAIEFPWDIKPIIRWHHEKYDGTGYPDRLKGEEIPVAAQIVGIADVFDALTTTRSYRGPLTRDKALQIIREGQSSWSAAVYGAFHRAVHEEAAAV